MAPASSSHPTSDATSHVQPNEIEGHNNGASSAEEVPIAPGTVCEIKIVNQVYDKEKEEWVEKVQTPKKGDRDALAEYVFVVNRKFSSNSGSDIPTITTVYRINSPWLRDVSQDVIGSDVGIAWTPRPSIDPEQLLAFVPSLRVRLNSLNDKLQKSEDEKITTSHLAHFTEYLEAEHAVVFESVRSLTEQGRITFDLLWAIFIPGIILHTKCLITSEPRAVRLIRSNKQYRFPDTVYWGLRCQYVDAAASGDTLFGLAQTQLELPEFDGAVPIVSLPTIPIERHPRVKELKDELLSRGKKWSHLTAIRHRHYNGIAFRLTREDPVKVITTGRMMIDSKAFAVKEIYSNIPTVYAPIQKLDNESLLLTSPVVYGFSLADKMWLVFCVQLVERIEWNESAFDNLVLPPNQKELLKSLVNDYSAGSSSFDDFMQGKGRGLIVNLFGNPGVGKTLTVEAISESLHRPLYVVSAGDFGATAVSVDKALAEIFRLAATWKAVVVIDEADVFLEERSLHDLERNAMVSVFLRQLEYFQGILFLTTNRVRVFDEAFQSRIHVSIHYPDLNSDARKQIWMSFMNTATKGHFSLSAEQIQDLADRDINGRQIKNVVKTALALAKSRKQELDYPHLREVLDIMMRFDAGTHGNLATLQQLKQFVSSLAQVQNLYFGLLVIFGVLVLAIISCSWNIISRYFHDLLTAGL